MARRVGVRRLTATGASVAIALVGLTLAAAGAASLTKARRRWR